LVGATWLALVPAVRAQEAADLDRVESALSDEQGRATRLQNKEAALDSQVERLQNDLVSAARRAQDGEEQIAGIETTLATIEESVAAKSADLAGRRVQLGRTLAALERLSLQPPQALLLSPERPVDVARTALLLRRMVPAVAARAADLRRELADLAQLRAEILDRRTALAAATAALTAERERIARLIERKLSLQDAATEEQKAAEARIALLGRHAKDLQDLLARLKTQADAVAPRRVAATAPPAGDAALHYLRPAAIRSFEARPGALTLPARGTEVARFGDPAGAGEAKGLAFATRPNAQVVAPFDGQVMFRGPFRGYGEILIIEHGGGYHTLLAGLARTDVALGQWLLAGEPVGVMGPATNGNPELYFELRHDGQPIDPSPWLGLPDPKKE